MFNFLDSDYILFSIMGVIILQEMQIIFKLKWIHLKCKEYLIHYKYETDISL